MRQILRVSSVAAILFLAFYARIAFAADKEEDLTRYGAMMQTFNEKSAQLDDKYSKEIERIKRETPPEKQQQAIRNATQSYKDEGKQLVQQYRQPVIDKLTEEANKGAPPGTKPMTIVSGTKIDDPAHRGKDGDTDITGTAGQVDKMRQTAQKMGLSDGQTKSLIPTEPGSDTHGDGLNLTAHKTGVMGPVGSSAHADQIAADAKSHETYVSVGMKDGQAGKDYVAVQDHTKKAQEGLNANPQELLTSPDKLQGMAKGTTKAIKDGGVTDQEIKQIMDQHGIQGDAGTLKQQLQDLKEGHAKAPEGAGVNQDNIGKIQAASKDILATASQKTLTQARDEIKQTEQTITQLEASGSKEDKTKANELRGQIIDTKTRMEQTGGAKPYEDKLQTVSGQSKNTTWEVTTGQQDGKGVTQIKSTQQLDKEDGSKTQIAADSKTEVSKGGQSKNTTVQDTSTTDKDGNITQNNTKSTTYGTKIGGKTDATFTDSLETTKNTDGSSKITQTKSSSVTDEDGNKTKTDTYVNETGKNGGMKETSSSSQTTKSADGKDSLTTETSTTTKSTEGGIPTSKTWAGSGTYEHGFDGQGKTGDGKSQDSTKPQEPPQEVKIGGGKLIDGSDTAKSTSIISGAGKVGDAEFDGKGSVKTGQIKTEGSWDATVSQDGTLKAGGKLGGQANAVNIELEGKAKGQITDNVSAEVKVKGQAKVGAEGEVKGNVKVGPDGLETEGSASAFVGGKLKGELEGSTTIFGVKVGGKAEGELDAGAGGEVKGGIKISWTGIKITGGGNLTVGVGGGGKATLGIDASEALGWPNEDKAAAQNKAADGQQSVFDGLKNGELKLPPGVHGKDVLDKAAWYANHPQYDDNGKEVPIGDLIKKDLGLIKVEPQSGDQKPGTDKGTKANPDDTKDPGDKTKPDDNSKPEQGNQPGNNPDKPGMAGDTEKPGKPGDTGTGPDGTKPGTDGATKPDGTTNQNGGKDGTPPDKGPGSGDTKPDGTPNGQGTDPGTKGLMNNEAPIGAPQPNSDDSKPNSQGTLDNFIGGKNSKAEANTQSAMDGMKGNGDVTKASNSGNDQVAAANNLVNQAGSAAQTTLGNSANQTAKNDNDNNWANTLGNAVTKGVQDGASQVGTTIGTALGGKAVNSVFGGDTHNTGDSSVSSNGSTGKSQGSNNSGPGTDSNSNNSDPNCNDGDKSPGNSTNVGPGSKTPGQESNPSNPGKGKGPPNNGKNQGNTPSIQTSGSFTAKIVPTGGSYYIAVTGISSNSLSASVHGTDGYSTSFSGTGSIKSSVIPAGASGVNDTVTCKDNNTGESASFNFKF